MKERKEAQESWELGQEPNFPVHLLCAGHCVGLFCCCFLLSDNLRWKGYSIHFTNEETGEEREWLNHKGHIAAGIGCGYVLRQGVEWRQLREQQKPKRGDRN